MGSRILIHSFPIAADILIGHLLVIFTNKIDQSNCGIMPDIRVNNSMSKRNQYHYRQKSMRKIIVAHGAIFQLRNSTEKV